jgi:phosphotransacetylase
MEVGILKQIKADASKLRKTIVLPESHDERVLQAAEILMKEKIVSVVTIGNEEKIMNDAKRLNINLNGLKIIDRKNRINLTNLQKLIMNSARKKG